MFTSTAVFRKPLVSNLCMTFTLSLVPILSMSQEPATAGPKSTQSATPQKANPRTELGKTPGPPSPDSAATAEFGTGKPGRESFAGSGSNPGHRLRPNS
jgi:hypothetical protein